MTQIGPDAPANLDAVTCTRADRLARATPAEMEAALSFLSMLDPEAFEIAFAAVPATSHDDDEPVPMCRGCGGLVGIFPDRGLRWFHVRGNSLASGSQQVHDPGHAPEVTWILPDEDLADL
jgi:hypothetical protein